MFGLSFRHRLPVSRVETVTLTSRTTFICEEKSFEQVQHPACEAHDERLSFILAPFIPDQFLKV